MSEQLLRMLPEVRGRYRASLPLGPLTWFRAGGPADVLFNPADDEDLAAFLRAKPRDVAVTPMGVASNMLVRDGGVPGVVVRLAGSIAGVRVDGNLVTAGAGCLDRHLAAAAGRAGLAGLEFYVGIPGTIGGGIVMNAGAFGGETAERLVSIEALDPRGGKHVLARDELGLSYRHSELPADLIVVSATFEAVPGDPEAIKARMDAVRAEREASQPLRVATGGSTFKNPPGHRAWQLIDAAGCRGLRHGAAMVSEKHCNFLINTGGATATELEELGEMVRARVRASSGIDLEWEIRRIGRLPDLAEAAA